MLKIFYIIFIANLLMFCNHSKNIENRILILDGGMGSEIKRRGLPFNEKEWSAKILMSDKEKDFNDLTEIHLDYIKSGAKIITTNSYGICLLIGRDKFIKNAEQYTKKSIYAAEKAREKSKKNDILIAGSISPVFGSYRPDLFNKKDAQFLYQKTIDPLIESKSIDILLSETISSTEEAIFFIEYINNKKTSKPYWLSFTLHDALIDNQVKLRSKEDIFDIEKVLSFIEKNNLKYPEAILFNCSQPEMITIAIDKLNQMIKNRNLSIKIGGYANRFVKNENIKVDVADLLRDLSTNDYLEFTKKWIKNGATIVGGCCGISPDYIKVLSNFYKF